MEDAKEKALKERLRNFTLSSAYSQKEAEEALDWLENNPMAQGRVLSAAIAQAINRRKKHDKSHNILATQELANRIDSLCRRIEYQLNKNQAHKEARKEKPNAAKAA